MKKKSKSFPSKAAYLEKNPVVSFHLPKEVLDKVNEMAVRLGTTKAKYLRDFFIEQSRIEEARQKALQNEVKKAYDEGFQEAKIIYCKLDNNKVVSDQISLVALGDHQKEPDSPVKLVPAEFSPDHIGGNSAIIQGKGPRRYRSIDPQKGDNKT